MGKRDLPEPIRYKHIPKGFYILPQTYMIGSSVLIMPDKWNLSIVEETMKMWYFTNGILFSYKEKPIYEFFSLMYGSEKKTVLSKVVHANITYWTGQLTRKGPYWSEQDLTCLFLPQWREKKEWR